MAKYCTKCGNPLEADGTCRNCQRTASGAPSFAPEEPVFFNDADVYAGEEEPSFAPEEPSFVPEEPQDASGERYFGQENVQRQQPKQKQQQTTFQSQSNGAQDFQNQNGNYGTQSTQTDWQQENRSRDYQQSAEGLFSALNGVSRALGGFFDGIYNFVTPTDKPGKVNNMVPVRKLLGFSKEDRIRQVGDCYERGMQIVPDLIQPCGQETPIRQYDLCTTRSLLKGTWQEGRLQVTNKRVLFRLSGRNWIGKTQKSIEFALDDVVGMDIQNGNRLSFVSLFLNFYIVALFAALGTFLTDKLPLLGAVLGLVSVFGIMLLLKKHYYAKAIVFAFALPGVMYLAEDSEKIGVILAGIVGIGFAIYYLLASIRPNLSFKVLTKSGSESPIEEKRVDTVFTMLFNYIVARGMDVLPGKDAERAMDEVGTMIMDIQKFGDFGINKWKQEQCL